MSAQVVPELRLDKGPYLILGFALTRQQYGSRGCLRPFYPFGMVVGYFGKLLRFPKNLFKVVVRVPHGAYAHGSTIPPALIRGHIAAPSPCVERRAVSPVGIKPVERFHVTGKGHPGENGVREGNGKNSIVGERASR